MVRGGEGKGGERRGRGRERGGEGKGGEGRHSMLSRPTFQLVPTPLLPNCGKSEDMYNRLDRTPACDRQTDRQTSCRGTVRAASLCIRVVQ